MQNIISYVKKYKDKTFYEEKFNEVDNLIFSTIIYLGTKNEKIEKKQTIFEFGEKYFKENTYKEVSSHCLALKEAYQTLKAIYNTPRYKDVIIYNYVYIGNEITQFCAATFKITNKLLYVAYEGTDDLIIGWKENFDLAYKFPTECQTLAINYLNKTVKLSDFLSKNIIIGGHSKGGNLALVASMYCNGLIRKKIKLIYNNDGPGLRRKTINTKEYEKIKNRYIHIVPDYSYVGVLLINEKYKVIKANRKDVYAHSPLNWKVIDNHFEESKLSTISKRLEKSLIEWLDNHDDIKREKMLTSLYNMLDKCEIKNINDLKNFKKLTELIKESKKIDSETKELTTSFIKYILKNVISGKSN